MHLPFGATFTRKLNVARGMLMAGMKNGAIGTLMAVGNITGVFRYVYGD